MAKLPLQVTNLPIVIEKLVPGGQGLATVRYDIKATSKTIWGDNLTDREKALLPEGKKGFIWNALPGETVTKYVITKSKPHFFEAIAEEYESPSNYRHTPKDACFLSTSPWQIITHQQELKLKQELLLETFRQANLTSALPEIINPVQTDGKDYFYRNKMEYSLYYDLEKSRIRLAQHQRGSHRKIPLETSSIERPEIFQKAIEIVDGLNQNGEEARKYQSLLLRCNQNGEVSGGLFENGKPHPIFDNLTDTILSQTYSYSPNGFFQINLPVYELALKEIAQAIDTDDVLDLYSGVGAIGLSVAKNQNLTLVESNKFAFQELKQNCKDVRAKNSGRKITPVLANSEDALEYIAPAQTVIVDPPRAGCDRKLLEKLIEVKPQTVVYLSCNPSTQARDLSILIQSSAYKIISITPYNFFPHTPHLENLVILKSTRNLL